MLSKILIIDKRKELSIKYKRALDGEQNSAIIAKNMKDALREIQQTEPELIIISDSIGDSLNTICERIRALTYNTRPVIVVLSKSADTTDKIDILNSGADDFWSEPVNIDEFKTRINAHLRREIESNLDNKTLLPNNKITVKTLKRILNSEGDQAVLLIGMDNFEEYKSVYSDIAGDKLVQALVAIINSTTEPEDFLGQLDSGNFILVTNPFKAEKVAAYLAFAFDTVAPKFYSDSDSKRGYMLVKGDRFAGMRVNFVSIQIGGILKDYELIKTSDALIERLYALKKTAKIPAGSSYIIDRVKLTGGNIDNSNTANKKIYINEPDESLALLIRTTLELQGYDVTDNINEEEALQPSILILDSGDNLESLEYCKRIKSNGNFVNSKIIVTASMHDKTAVLNAGADLYLPKPYELTDLVRWIEYFYKSINNY